MQESKICPECGNKNLDYRFSDRHRGYYECKCGQDITVSYYV